MVNIQMNKIGKKSKFYMISDTKQAFMDKGQNKKPMYSIGFQYYFQSEEG